MKNTPVRLALFIALVTSPCVAQSKEKAIDSNSKVEKVNKKPKIKNKRKPKTGTITDNTFGIRIAPLGLLLGAISGHVDFKIQDKFVISPSFLHMDFSILGNKIEGPGYGFNVSYHSNGSFNDGLYYEGFVNQS